MFQSTNKGGNLSLMETFYCNKSILITGAAGFIGSILLETLLRCCPEIKSIYILLRSRENVQPEVRKEEIFNKKIFEKMKEETPELLEKVYVIPGDATLTNLGMSEKHVLLLVEEVSIVFHCAAVVNFIKPLKFTLKNNVLSLSSVIGLCKRMRKCEALIFTSTAYSNCNRLNCLIKEEVYRLPFHSEKFLDALKNEDDKTLQELVNQCKPNWPNSYTFSKCLAENVIIDMASDLPVAIIRPSIVICTYKNPMPGYVEGNSGIVALSVGAGKGFVKVLYSDPNVKLNLVPADIVVNAHVLAAWSIGTKRCVSPLVLNCTATNNFNMKLCEYNETMIKIVFKYPLPLSFEKPSSLKLVPYKYLYYILAAYHHYIPAVFLDGMLKVLGKKPKVFYLYRFFDTVMKSLRFFLFHSFEFEKNNLEYLNRLLHSEDRKDLCLDFRDLTLSDITEDIPAVSPFYNWKLDKNSQSERERIKHQRHMLITFIQWVFLMICCLLFYWVLSFFFSMFT